MYGCNNDVTVCFGKYIFVRVQIYNFAGTGTVCWASIHCVTFTTAAGGSTCKLWICCFCSSGSCLICTFNTSTCAKFNTTSCGGRTKSGSISTADWGCCVSSWHHSYTDCICVNSDTSAEPSTETCHHAYCTGLLNSGNALLIA